jgi:hypothetical protein
VASLSDTEHDHSAAAVCTGADVHLLRLALLYTLVDENSRPN